MTKRKIKDSPSTEATIEDVDHAYDKPKYYTGIAWTEQPTDHDRIHELEQRADRHNCRLWMINACLLVIGIILAIQI